jgi:hypothetical protein
MSIGLVSKDLEGESDELFEIKPFFRKLSVSQLLKNIPIIFHIQ